MSAEYPRIKRVDPRPRSQGVRCKACGEPARWRSHVEFSWFRGEDEVVWSCDSHRYDATSHAAAIEAAKWKSGDT